MKKQSWIYYVLFLFFGLFIGVQLSKFVSRPTISSGALDQIKQLIINNYVDTVNVDKLNDAAIEAMLNTLDPFSAFLPVILAKEADDDLQGKFDGIGVQFRMIDDTVTIIQPISGGPSEKLGILAGDRIISVDGEVIAGVNMSTDEVMRRLKGPKGTTVNVEILRTGIPKPLKFSIVRAVIPTYSVDVDFMVDETIGYIKLSKFSATTSEEVHNALKRLNKQGMEKLIFDLRGNGGGFLHEAIQVVDEFLPDGKLIVYTEGRNRPRQDAFATRYGVFENKPIVVLIDEWSASASEIIAGALQDNDAGTIIGRRSFGKGLVQEQIRLNNGASIRLTVARYYTPSGRYIQTPFTQGQHDFEEQLIKRLTEGELLSPDSIKLDTTQRFLTLGGRVVYGGGGIMPDIYVPYTVDSTRIYINLLSNRGLILRYTFNYSNEHRKLLLRTYPDIATFKEKFQVSQPLIDGLIAYGKSNGLAPDLRSIELHRDRLKGLLKAYIARDLYGDSGFFPIYLPLDDDFKKAMEVLK
ncbi:MAG: S41 family peptidase [Bacteroidales bacterium]|jgi:carboxyl-terminal processing protease|nr:S41 family peptidase [Bacteroidales bacterium]